MFLLQLIIVMTIMFGVVIFILKKMMYGDTQSAVNRLNESYQEIEKKKQEMATLMQKMEEEYKIKKEEGEKIALQLKDAAEAEMREKYDSSIKKAKDEAERIITDAAGMKDRIREEIRKEEDLKEISYCEELISDTLKKIIRDKFDDILIEDFVNDLKDIDMSHVPPAINEIEIVTRAKLADGIKNKIVESVNKKTQKKITFKETIDQKIIGGVIIKFGSLVLDGSIAGKLKENTIVKKKKIDEKT